MSGSGETDLRPRVRELLQAVQPPMAPVDAIVRRGRGIRLRRAAAVAGGLGVVAIIAAATLLPSPPAPVPLAPPLPVTVPASGIAGPDGIVASGTADGHAWRLAVQDIADPGYRCIPAITVNGTDAAPVSPIPGTAPPSPSAQRHRASVSRSCRCRTASKDSASTARKASRRSRSRSAGSTTGWPAWPTG